MKSGVSSGKQGLALIESYPFAQVREKPLLGRKIAPNLIDEAISEFRKYLKLVALGHKNIAMVSREVDEVWHTFILFTRDYTEFCQNAFGAYLHHQPSIPSQPMDPAARQRLVAAYRQEFGDMPAIWASPTDGCCGEECAPDKDCNSQIDSDTTSLGVTAVM